VLLDFSNFKNDVGLLGEGLGMITAGFKFSAFGESADCGSMGQLESMNGVLKMDGKCCLSMASQRPV
jgi:hypothetical protein